MSRTTASAAERQRPWHEALEHGAARELWVHALTWPELVAEAGRALGEVLLPGTPVAASPHWRDLAVQGTSRDDVLTRWLGELLYHAEAEWWVAVEFADLHATNADVSARVRGAQLSTPPVALSTAALERVRVRPVPAGLEAEIVLRT